MRMESKVANLSGSCKTQRCQRAVDPSDGNVRQSWTRRNLASSLAAVAALFL